METLQVKVQKPILPAHLQVPSPTLPEPESFPTLKLLALKPMLFRYILFPRCITRLWYVRSLGLKFESFFAPFCIHHHRQKEYNQILGENPSPEVLKLPSCNITVFIPLC